MVSLVQIKSMEEPYGLCDPEHNTPMSDCRVDCRTREIVSVCGCGDVYMSYMKNDTDSKRFEIVYCLWHLSCDAGHHAGQFDRRGYVFWRGFFLISNVFQLLCAT